jgi:hypothetical protein
MLIIKPYGRSVTKSDVATRQLHDTKSKQHFELPQFSKSDPRIIIAQWIAIVDKIIRKPNQADQIGRRGTTGDALREVQIKFRTRLGEACWKKIEPDIAPDIVMATKRHWDWKLQPFGDTATTFNNSKLTEERHIRGGWYQAFLTTSVSETKDFELLASAIFQHLNTQERRKSDGRLISYHPNKNETTAKRGLIERRATSIAGNTLTAHMQKIISTETLLKLAQETEAHAWSCNDEAAFSVKSDLANEIYNLAIRKEKSNKRLSPSDAAICVYKHYGTQFGSKTRLEISEKGLLALYDAVRTYYREFLKNTKKGREGFSKLSRVLPENNNALFKLLKSRDTNAVVNDLIRLGRVLHYERTTGDQDGIADNKEEKIWARSLSDIAKSEYWSSEKQDDIKRTEAFVRVWRNAFTLAARTAKNMVDPESKITVPLDKGRLSADIISDAVALLAKENGSAQTRLRESLPLLVGTRCEFFKEVKNSDLVYASLRTLGKLRNEIFHIKFRRSFVTRVKVILGDAKLAELNFHNTLKLLYETDKAEEKLRLRAVISAAFIPNFMDNDALKKFYTAVQSSTQPDLTLPKLNRLLLRVNGTGPDSGFPAPASRSDLKAPWRLAKFIGFKLIYEGPFRIWLDGMNRDGELNKLDLIEFAKTAKKRTTEAAQALHKTDPNKDLILAKAESLPMPEKNDRLIVYLKNLQGYATSEMRIQNGYESDPELARDAMAWIDEFICDLIALIFAKYLKDKKDKFRPIIDLDQNSKQHDTPSKFPLGETREILSDEHRWQASLYYALHFVPVDDVSRLFHQFKKWGVLEAKVEQTQPVDEDVDRIKKTLALYIQMHDAKHDGAGLALSGLDIFWDLFEKKAVDFDRVFKTDGSTDDELASTRRGLREIMRFGHLRVLSAAMSKSLITTDQVNQMFVAEAAPTGGKVTDSPIAKAQSERKEIHARLAKLKPREQDQASLSEYSALLKTINSHRHLANHVRLNYHIRLHRLLMRVVSRLVDYAGLWERDGYFIALALMRLHNKQPTDVLNSEAGSFLKQGQLPAQDQIDNSFLITLNRFHTQPLRHIRNNIAHFNFLESDDVDLGEAIIEVRRLLSYDRKLKNAVTKSIKDILFEEGLSLNWSMKDHALVEPQIASRTIQHLKQAGDAFKEFLHHADYVKMVQQLFVPNSPISMALK